MTQIYRHLAALGANREYFISWVNIWRFNACRMGTFVPYKTYLFSWLSFSWCRLLFRSMLMAYGYLWRFAIRQHVIDFIVIELVYSMLSLQILLSIDEGRIAFFMMTSSNGNIFRVTGPLWGEFTGRRWTFLTKAQWRGALMFSLICASINACGRWFETPLRSLWRHCNAVNWVPLSK